MIQFVAWLGQHERGLLLTGLILAAGSWFSAELADRVMAGRTGSFDRRVLLALRNSADLTDPLGPEWLEEIGRDMTALGGVGVVSLLSGAVLVYLALQGQFKACMVVIIAVAGGLLLSLALKGLFDRPRPDLVPHGSYVSTASFPSGHSMLSAVTYLTLGALLARVHAQRRIKAFLLLIAFIVTALVGVSRVYLGVHWPTDVLSGWTAGAMWALVCWEIARRLQRTGRMEASDEPEEGPPVSSPL